MPAAIAATAAARGFNKIPYAGYSTGNLPNFYYFGGLNTLRGYDFRSIIGNQAAFANFEFRFPLIDILATPIIAFTRCASLAPADSPSRASSRRD